MRKAGLEITGYAVFVLLAGISAFGVEPGAAGGEPNLPGQIQSIRKQILCRQMEALDESAQKSSVGGLKDKLETMIEQIGLLRIPAGEKKGAAEKEDKGSGKGSASTAGDVNKAGENQPQEDIKAVSAEAEPGSAKVEKSQQPERDVLSVLDGIKDVERPMAVADVLYLKRDYNRAARFYEMELGRLKPEGQEPQRQWALFQLGNCYRDSDAVRASGYFERLISEYPSCSWADAANVQRRCRLWMKQNETKLLQSLEQSEPNSI